MANCDLGEVFYFSSDHVNTTFIGRIQLFDTNLHQRGSIGDAPLGHRTKGDAKQTHKVAVLPPESYWFFQFLVVHKRADVEAVKN